MNAYRDYNGLWRIDGYQEIGSFSTEEDALAAIDLAFYFASDSCLKETRYRKAAARGAAKREANAQERMA